MKLQLEIELVKSGDGNMTAVVNGVKALGDESKKAHEKGAASAKGHAEALRNVYIQLMALREGVDIFKKIFERGIEFNAEMQKSQLLIAGLVNNNTKVYDSMGRVVAGADKFNMAMRIAGGLQQQVLGLSLRTGLAYQDLAETMQIVLAAGHGQIKNQQQLLDLTLRITKAGTVTGFVGAKLMMETRSLMTGNRSELGMLLGITQHEASQAMGAGNLIEFINKKLEIFEMTSQKFRSTVPGAWGAFKNAVDQALGQGTQGQMSGIVNLLNEMIDKIVKVDKAGNATFNPAFVQSVSAIADAFLQVARAISAMAVPVMVISRGFTALVNVAGGVASAIGEAFFSPFVFAEERIANLLNTVAAEIEKHPTIMRLLFNLRPEHVGELRSMAGNFSAAGASDSAVKEMFANMRKQYFEAAYGGVSPWTPTQANAPGGRFGAGHRPPLDPEIAAQSHALRERIELETKLAGIAKTRLELEAQQATLAERLSKTDLALEAEKQRIGGARLDQTTQQLILQDRMLRMRQVDLETEIATTNEARRYADQLSKIAKDREANSRLARKDPRAALPGGAFDAAQRAADAEHAAAQAKIDADADRARQKARQENAKIAKQTLDDRRKETDQRLADERKFEELRLGWEQRFINDARDLYENMIDAISKSTEEAFVGIFSGRGIRGALDGLVQDFQRSLAKMTGGEINRLLERWRAMATGQDYYDPKTNSYITPTAGQQRNAKMGLGFTESAIALYGLYQQGKNVSKQQNAISGAATGAGIGGQFGGFYGAIAGALIGGLAGYMTGGNKAGFELTVKDGQISVVGHGKATASQVDDALRNLNTAIRQAREGAWNLVQAFPMAIMNALSVPGDPLADQIIGHLDPFKSKTFFGKLFDMNPGLRALRAKAHKVVSGLSGDALQHFINVELPKMYLEAYEPLIKQGLGLLGVSDPRIAELMASAKAKDPKDAFNFITEYVTAFSKMKDFVDFIGKSAAGKAKTAADTLNATTPDQLAKLNEKLLFMAQGFSELSSDEQLSRMKQINDLTDQRYQLELQYLNEIAETAKTVHKSVMQQIFGMQLSDATRPGAISMIEARRSAIIGQGRRQFGGELGAAKTPAEIRALAQEYQELTGQLYQFAVAVRDEFKSLLVGFKTLAELPGKDAAAAKTPVERVRDLSARIIELGTNFDKLTGEEQLTRGRELLNLANERYQIEKAALEEIAHLSKSIGDSISEQIFGIEQDQRKNNPQAQLDALLGRQRTLYEQLGKAGTAQEVDFIIGQIQKNASSVYDLQGNTPAAAANTIDMLNKANDLAQKKLHEFADALKSTEDQVRSTITAVADVIAKSFNDASAAVTGLQNDLLNLDAAVKTATERLFADVMNLDAALDPLKGVLDAFGASTAEATADLNALDGPLKGFRDRINEINDGLDRGGFPSRHFPGSVGGQAVPVTFQPVIQVTLQGSAERWTESVAAEVVDRVETRQARRSAMASRLAPAGRL